MTSELIEQVFYIVVWAVMFVLYLIEKSRADREKGRADCAMSALDSLLTAQRIERVTITRTTTKDSKHIDTEASSQ